MKIKNLVMGIAIIILSFSVVVYGISMVYERPQYEDYCRPDFSKDFIKTVPEVCPQVCVPIYEIVKDECLLNECGSGCGADNISSFATLQNCVEELEIRTCYLDYEDAVEVYSRNLFLITLPLGIAIIIVGALVFGFEVVGAGLMGGGVLTILYGVGNYWQYSADVLKFILSLIGLVIIIYLAYRINRK